MITDNKIKDGNEYIIIEASGGMGKNIQSTAFIRAVKKEHPNKKIIVTCSWDGPFFNNPNIFRFYVHGQMQYWNSDFLNENTVIMKHDPYNSTDHILRKEHLIESWCKLYDILFDGYKPEIYLNPRELEIAKDKIKPNGKPIMLLQTHGGGNGQYSKKSWYRDLPIEQAQQIVNHFKDKYRILHLRREDQLQLQNVEVLNLPHRELYSVFLLSEKRLFIDSFAQHAAAALGLQSTVCWIGNDHKVFGYGENLNIYPNAKIINNFNKFNYLGDDISGFIQNFPYDTVNVFDVDEIISAVENQL